MSAKTSDWRPGPTVCRCCLSEGCYKDISTEYFWMGKREVYVEMLTETFDLNIAFSQTPGPNSNSRLICEPCIARLRDATEFKRQVRDCEKTFLNYLDPTTSSIIEADDEPLVDLDKDVKLECVKEEAFASDDDEDYMPPADMNDDDDDDDDLDNEPLTKLASKLPKNESFELSESENSSKKPSKRKSTLKLKESSPKKTKTKKDSAKATVSKAVAKIEKKKKDNDYSGLVRKNAESLIKYTTAFPFRINVKEIVCVFCGENDEDPETFREHMEEAHKTYDNSLAFKRIPKAEPIRVDIRDLKCRNCSEQFESIKDAAVHLKEAHKVDLNLDISLGVMSFRLDEDTWSCIYCKKDNSSLLHLNKHVLTHYLTYICDICGKAYFSATGLSAHTKREHINGEAMCRTCNKRFPSVKDKIQHRKTEKRCMPYCCSECPERFVSWETKQRHMTIEHGKKKLVYECELCEYKCGDRKTFHVHHKLSHAEDCHVCSHCGMRFASNTGLVRHLQKHNLQKA